MPCGGCTACCRSSQFVHIGPDEVDTLERIPSSLLFPAPRLPLGHVLMGYDERGCCPMLVDDRCTIYEHRPLTCRTYDCRVFPATGNEPDDPDGPIARQARRWRFAHPADADVVEHDAVRAAAAVVREREREGADGVPATATGRAVVALRLSAAFVAVDRDGRPALVEPDPAELEHRAMG